MHRIPFLLWLSMLIYPLDYPFSSTPLYLCCIPFQMHRGAEWHRVFTVKMLVIIFLSVLYPLTSLQACAPTISSSLSLIRIWSRGFALISPFCHKSPVCHWNSLSCGYRTNNKNNSQPKFPSGTWLSLGCSPGFQKQHLSFPTYPGINKPCLPHVFTLSINTHPSQLRGSVGNILDGEHLCIPAQGWGQGRMGPTLITWEPCYWNLLLEA